MAKPKIILPCTHQHAQANIQPSNEFYTMRKPDERRIVKWPFASSSWHHAPEPWHDADHDVISPQPNPLAHSVFLPLPLPLLLSTTKRQHPLLPLTICPPTLDYYCFSNSSHSRSSLPPMLPGSPPTNLKYPCLYSHCLGHDQTTPFLARPSPHGTGIPY